MSESVRQRSQKHVSQACAHCRRRRRKCDREETESTCSQCLKDNVECLLEDAPDQRLRHYHQRHKRTLSKVLKTIRAGEEAETASLLALIRDGASETVIENHVDTIFAGASDATFISRSSSQMDEVPSVQGPPLMPTLSSGVSSGEEPSTGLEYLKAFEPFDASSATNRAIWQSTSMDGPWKGKGKGRGSSAVAIDPAEEFQAGYSLPPSSRQLPVDDHDNTKGKSPKRPADAHDQMEPSDQKNIEPGATRHFGNLPMSRSILTNNFPDYIQARQLQVIGGRMDECLPLNLDTESRADRLSSAIVAFRDTARSMIARGQPADSVLSMKGLEVDLMFRDRRPGDPHNVSTWACEYSKTWTFLPLHVRLASVFFAGTFMRWAVLPCAETYALMSNMMRPLPSQLFVPHSGDIDICHLPCLRSVQLDHGGKWVDRITADTQRCHWLKGDHSCVEEKTIEDGGRRRSMKTLSDAFVEFVDDARNWTLLASVLDEFPALRGRVSFHDDEEV